jgi:hypothetical protein
MGKGAAPEDNRNGKWGLARRGVATARAAGVTDHLGPFFLPRLGWKA